MKLTDKEAKSLANDILNRLRMTIGDEVRTLDPYNPGSNNPEAVAVIIQAIKEFRISA